MVKYCNAIRVGGRVVLGGEGGILQYYIFLVMASCLYFKPFIDAVSIREYLGVMYKLCTLCTRGISP